MEKSGPGIKLLMLETGELRGEERSMISLFFREYFLVSMPIGLILNGLNSGLENGPIMNLSLISFPRVCRLCRAGRWQTVWHVQEVKYIFESLDEVINKLAVRVI